MFFIALVTLRSASILFTCSYAFVHMCTATSLKTPEYTQVAHTCVCTVNFIMQVTNKYLKCLGKQASGAND